MENVIKKANIEDYKRLPGTFWVITSFYNPNCTKNKLINYLFFRKKLKEQGVNLLTVECAFKKQNFNLNKKDADILIQVRSNSILWQKERLLNISLKNLPPDCDKIGCLDADVVILDDNWSKAASMLLEKYQMVKPFSEAVRLKENETAKILGGENLKEYMLMNSKDIHEYYSFNQERSLVYLATLGICARREIFKDIYFYDKMILGSGDLIMANIFLNSNYHVEDIDISEYFSPNLKKDINNWYKSFREKNGNMGIVKLDVLAFHLFHGLTSNRNYQKRQIILKKYNYEPEKDLILNDYNCFEWSGNKRKFEQAVSLYFKSRNEDNKIWKNIKPYIIRRILKYKNKARKKNYLIFTYFNRLIGMVGTKIKRFSPVTYRFLKKMLFKSKS